MASRLELTALQPGPTDRAGLYGQTGSGKTTLARHLVELSAARTGKPILVFDWKGLIRWPGYQRHTALKSFVSANPTRGIYAPSYRENNRPEFFEGFFKYCFLRGRATVYVDEVARVTNGNELPIWYHACLTQGRERGLSLYSSSQRPIDIPQVILSEAEHTFVFRLQMKQDREKVESTTGIARETIAGLPKRVFFYANAEGDISGPYKLNFTQERG